MYLLYLNIPFQIDVIRAFRTTPEAPVVWSFSFLGVLIGCAFVLLATVNLWRHTTYDVTHELDNLYMFIYMSYHVYVHVIFMYAYKV